MATRQLVGVRELKTRLGTYLQRVRQGRTLVVTDRGEPVAELRPITNGTATDAVLAKLEAAGAVTRPTRRTLVPFQPITSRGGSVTAALVEDRDDRF
jgi:prevent-host-death family protein